MALAPFTQLTESCQVGPGRLLEVLMYRRKGMDIYVVDRLWEVNPQKLRSGV